MREIILTSKSPRRQQILAEFGYDFRVFPIEVSEILNKNLNLPERISDCAHQKVQAAYSSDKLLKSKDELLLGADTVVVFQETVLGKPKNEQEAISILDQLSGQIHQVITGFCLLDLNTKRTILGHDSTEVRFRDLGRQEILDYVASGDPMDKAGSYGIQGEARKFVSSVSGSINNVIGLPIEKIQEVFKVNDWSIKKKPQ